MHKSALWINKSLGKIAKKKKRLAATEKASSRKSYLLAMDHIILRSEGDCSKLANIVSGLRGYTIDLIRQRTYELSSRNI